MAIVILLLLIVINGIFAMAEIAIVTARKSRLQQLASDKNVNAGLALELANNPNRLLSTVQIGITLIGILAGAYGGATVASDVAKQLERIAVVKPYSEPLAFTLVVLITTYLSLIIGELVPKRLALSHPERFAQVLARPMNAVSKLSAPAVTLLSLSTDWVLRVLRIAPSTEPSVSEEDVRMLIREGAKVGVFEVAEKDIVERTLRLGDKQVNKLMTPRQEVVWLDEESSLKLLRNKIIKSPHSHYPVCSHTIDRVVGVVRSKDLLTHFLREGKLELSQFIRKPLFVPESMNSLKVLEVFKKSGIRLVIVIDEYGNMQGVLTLNDILEAIVGDIPAIDDIEEKDIIKRDNGTFLVDGLISTDEFKEYFHIKRLPGEKTGIYHTLGGFVMSRLGKIPVTGDRFDYGQFRFEVIDMDGHRVDKILLTPLKKKLL